MQNILVLQHVPHEGLGSMKSVLENFLVEIEYCHLYRNQQLPESPRSFALIIIMGSPINVDGVANHPYLENECQFIRDAISNHIPLLGICFGAQLIAKVMGAKVFSGNKKEIGWYDIDLTSDAGADPVFFDMARRTLKVFQWHGDTFELPSGARSLAFSDLYDQQAFSYQNRIYALQFHLEVTPQIIQSWLQENQHELLSVRDYIIVESILNDSILFQSRLRRVAALIFQRIFMAVQLFPKQNLPQQSFTSISF